MTLRGSPYLIWPNTLPGAGFIIPRSMMGSRHLTTKEG